VLLPLCNIADANLPVVVTNGGTNYSAAWEVLGRTIAADAARFREAGVAMLRPLAWFLTDGAPQDPDWELNFQKRFHYNKETKVGNNMYPRVVPVGIGEAPMDVLTRLAYPPENAKAFKSAPGTPPAEAFKAAIRFAGQTIISTGQTGLNSGGGAPSHVVGESIEGFDSQDSEYAGEDWVVPPVS
jgi:hypothetical protein